MKIKKVVYKFINITKYKENRLKFFLKKKNQRK